MGNYISSKYNNYFEAQNSYKSILETDNQLSSPLSTHSYDPDCPDIFNNEFLVLARNRNSLSDNSDNETVSNLIRLKKRYQELLIYNSYLKLEYNNCLQDNNELLCKIEKIERQNIYFKQKIYKINISQNPFKHRRKTV